MKSNFNQIFFLKRSKSRVGATPTVYLRITIDGTRTEVSLQRKCDPEKWISDKGRVNGKTEDVKALNKYLDSVQSRIYEIFQTLVSSGTEFDGENIKAGYLGYHKEKPRTLLEVYEAHNMEFERLVGKGLSYRTLQKYRTIKAYVSEFLEYQYALNDIELHKLDYQFIKNFEIYLKTIKHCCHNTAMDYLNKIKKFLNQCIVKNRMFTGFRMSVNETHKTFLTEEELMALTSKKISIPRLEQVRDIFVFSCYTGLAYCDVAKITAENVVIGIDGEKWIFICRSKTNTPSKIPCFPFQILS